MPIFKTIIVGCGNIAGGFDATASDCWPLTHAGAFSAHQGFKIIACCDPDTKKRKAFQERWNIPLGVDYPEDLDASRFPIDVISLCSPTKLHTKHLKIILDLQPKLLFCEKPIATKINDVAFWVDQYAAHNIPFIVNYNRRWDPDIISLKNSFTNMAWGKIRSVSAAYNKGILNNGGHMIDLLHYLLGPMRVIAAGSEVYDFWSDDPSVPALLETHDGIPITLNIADAQDYSFFEAQFITEYGTLCMESGGMNWSIRAVTDSPDFPGYRVIENSKIRNGRYQETMTRAVDNIYEALTQGADIPSTGATALQAQKICLQIQQRTETKPSYSETSNDR